MFAVMCANGQTGSAVAKKLLSQGQATRVILRNDRHTKTWQELGAEVAYADVRDAQALSKAFEGCDGAYVMNPPAYFVDNMFETAKAVFAAILTAVNASDLKHVVELSSIGAQHATGTGNIITNYDFEQVMKGSKVPVTVLRASNFMENWVSALDSAKNEGVLPSMFVPLDKKIPNIATADIGSVAADLLMQGVDAPKLVELTATEDYSANDVAEILAGLLGRPVNAQAVPYEAVLEQFTSWGFPKVSVLAFGELFDGFNTDHTVFSNQGVALHGATTMSEVLKKLLNV